MKRESVLNAESEYETDKKGEIMQIFKKITIGIFLLGTFSATAGNYTEPDATDGNEVYLDAYLRVTKKKKLASYYCTIEERASEGYHVKAYFLTGELKMDGWYADEEMRVEQGLFTYFYQSGQIESAGEYKEGVKVGIWKRFDSKGNEKPEKVYQSLEVMQAIEEAKKLEQKN